MKWIIMPVLAGPEMTEAAINDCVAMEGTELLVINQGVDDDFRDHLERLAEAIDQLHVWHHNPPLASLGASWNRALDFVWQSGGEEALVINNDVRLRPDTYGMLSTILDQTGSMFVTCIGVTEAQWRASLGTPGIELVDDLSQRGGPDFSCYMISKTCHELYRFDENFVPAYCEDLDYHRRLMLDEHSDQIFSVNLPYWHLAAQTLKQVDPQKRMKIESSIGANSRAYYQKKWGGPVNKETFYAPFGNVHHSYTDISTKWAARCGPSTPEIQAWCQAADRGVVPPESVVRKTPPLYEGLKPHVMMPHEPDPYPLQPADIDAKERG